MTKVLLLFTLILSASAVVAQPLQLVKNGKPNATIILAKDATQRMQWAAGSLQTYIQKISGVKLPLKKDGKDVPGITLNVGKTDTALESDLPDASLNPESYAIKVRNDDIYFAARYPTAVTFAVHSFIEDNLGVRWFAPGDDWEYVPQLQDKSTFTVEVKSVVKEPDTSPRFWSSHKYGPEWNSWNFHNKIISAEKTAPWRGFQNYIYKIFPPEKYAKTHPEYYPLINGKRVIPQKGDVYWWPCIGNKDVQRITAEYIHQFFVEHPNVDSFSLGMDDIYTMCQDSLCRAMDAHPDDDKNRHYSDRYYKFINIVAAQVKKTDPGKYIGLLVYDATRQLPQTVPHIEDNVFGYITQNSSYWNDPARKKADLDLTAAWSKRMKHLSRYDYYGFKSLAPRVYPHLMDKEIKFDKQHNLEGMYTEVYTFLPHTAPMIWAFAKLQWDSSHNIDDLLNDFYTKMFGAGAPEMQKYFSLLEKCWAEDKPGFDRNVLKNIIQQALVMTPDDVQQGFALLDAAASQAQQPIEKKRIEIIRAALQYYSYMPLEYHLAQQLSQSQFQNAADAQRGLEQVAQLGQLITAREKFWPAVEQRDDLLGANLRGFDKGSRTGLLRDMSPIENPVIPALLHLTDWYRKNQPAQAAQVAEQIKSTFPAGAIRSTLTDWNWVADHHPASLVKNGNFESTVANTMEVQADWRTENIPDGWASWSRYRFAKFSAAAGHQSNKAVRIGTPVDKSDSGIVLQNLNNLKPGSRYLATAWVKVAPERNPAGISLALRLRSDNAWYSAKKGSVSIKTVAAPTDEWQQLIVSITLPSDADGVSVQLNASNSEAVFDDIALYEMSEQ